MRDMRADRQGLPLHWCLWGPGVVCQMNWRLPYLQPWYPKLPRKGNSVSLLFHRDINFLHRSLVFPSTTRTYVGRWKLTKYSLLASLLQLMLRIQGCSCISWRPVPLAPMRSKGSGCMNLDSKSLQLGPAGTESICRINLRFTIRSTIASGGVCLESFFRYEGLQISKYQSLPARRNG